jgi:phosphoglucomutase
MQAYKLWLDKVSADEKSELLAIENNISEIKERFEMELDFGTAGMRGEVGLGTYRMNLYTVRRATAGLAKYIAALGDAEMKRGVVIAYDTRRFSREFAFAAAAVLSHFKINVNIFEDVRPVPMCSFAVRKLNAKAGVMITASHNPKEYNGYKVYGEDGAQMSPEPTAAVVSYIKQITDYFSVEFDKIDDIYGYVNKDNFKLNNYVTVIGASIDKTYFDEIEKLCLSKELTEKNGKNIKLVYTPIHGAGYMPVTTIFNRLGINATLVEEQCAPDTEFSTVPVPNPENPQTMKLGVELGNKIGADVVLATDPDADRLGVAVRNTKGEFVLLSGNQIGALLFDYICVKLKEDNKMPKNAALVKSIVSTTLVDRMAKDCGVKVFDVLTGFKFIGEKIKEWESSGEYTYIFGFEESFGTLRGTHARDKDAVVGAMLFAEMLIYWESKGKTVNARLNEIFKKYGYYLELNTSITYKGLTGMAEMAEVMKNLRKKDIPELYGEEVLSVADFSYGFKRAADGRMSMLPFPKSDMIMLELKDKQFVCIRPSGTEPKLKIYILIYDKTEAKAKAKADEIMLAINDDLLK